MATATSTATGWAIKPASVAAFFDVDGTLTRTTLLQPLIWYQRARLSRPRFLLWAAELLLQIPRYVWIDRRSRAEFNVLFYRRYRGLNVAHLRSWHRQTFPENLQRTIFPRALDCVRGHRQRGHRIVLVTGGLGLVMEPLAEHLPADHVIAMSLQDKGGLLTGELGQPPIADEQKAVLARAYAEQHDIDLAQSFAYGNSWGDVPLLTCVRHAVAVNPDSRLRPFATERAGKIERWDKS